MEQRGKIAMSVRESRIDTQSQSSKMGPQTVQRLAFLLLFIFTLPGIPATWNYLRYESALGPGSSRYLFFIVAFQSVLILVAFSLFASSGMAAGFSSLIDFVKRRFLSYVLSVVLVFVVLLIIALFLLPTIEAPGLLLFWLCQLAVIISTCFVVFEPAPSRLQVHLSVFALMVGIIAAEKLLMLASITPPTDIDYLDVYQSIAGDIFRSGGLFLPNLNVMVVGDSPTGKVHFITNSKGFRNDRDFDFKPDPNVFRIIFAGDSFVGGFRVDQEDTAGRVIEKKLSGFAGQGGLQTRSEVLISTIDEPGTGWLWLTEEGMKYNPDLVIFGITLGNDLAQTYISMDPLSAFAVSEGAERGSYTIARGNGRQRIGFRTTPIVDLLLPPDAYVSETDLRYRIEKIKATLARTQLNVRISGATSGAVGWPCPIRSWYGDQAGRVHAFDALHGLGFFYTSPTGSKISEVEEAFERLDIVLQGVNHLCKEHDAEFLVVIFPQRFQVDDRDWEITAARYGLNSERFDRDLPDRRILASCAKYGINCLDLLPRFREVAGQGVVLYLPQGDMHWNAAGQRLAGETIAKFVWENLLKNRGMGENSGR
jgi:hypothetical protein